MPFSDSPHGSVKKQDREGEDRETQSREITSLMPHGSNWQSEPTLSDPGVLAFMHTPPRYLPCGGKHLEKPTTLFRHLFHVCNQDFFYSLSSLADLVKGGVPSWLPSSPQCMARV